MGDSKNWFQDDGNYALFAGFNTARLLDKGVPVTPIMDGAEHTPLFIFDADYGGFAKGDVLAWAPPPEGWSIADEANILLATRDDLTEAQRNELRAWANQVLEPDDQIPLVEPERDVDG